MARPKGAGVRGSRVVTSLWEKGPGQILSGLQRRMDRRWVDEGPGRIVREDRRVPLLVRKAPGARIILRGDLRITSHQGDYHSVAIEMGHHSTLILDGDIVLMQGTKIVLSSDAELYLGGNENEKDCGTVGNCRIMVRRKVHIGKDFLCSWNVFITDCDWHAIDGRVGQKETHIGDHVWVTCNCSILKGSRIGPGCIVANGTVIHNQEFGPNDLIAGNPAVARRKIGAWQR